jgi:hypothetical protein
VDQSAIEANKKVGGDQYLAFLPSIDKFDIVKEVNAKHWAEDDFFVNELFNGCNPT